MTRLSKFVIAMALIVVWGCGDSPTAPTSTGTSPQVTQQSQQGSQAQQSETPTPPANPAPAPSPSPDGDEPTPEPTPTPTPAPAPAPPTTGPAPAPPSNPGTPSGASCVGLGVITRDGLNWKVQNKAPYACTWTGVTFLMKVPYGQPGWDDQTFYGWSSITLQPGQSGAITSVIPPCGPKEQPIQLDIYPATQEQLGPNAEKGHPRNLIIKNEDAMLPIVPACPPPPPPPPPPPTPSCEVVNLQGSVVQSAIDDVGVGVRASATWVGSGTVTVDWDNGQTATLTTQNRSALMIYQRGNEDVTRTVTFTYNGESASVCKTTKQFVVPKKPTPPPPPPPPPCSVTNPASLVTTGSITQLAHEVRVRLDYTYSNIQNVSVGIWWEKGENKWLKDSRKLYVKCEDGQKSGHFTWSSPNKDHFPDNGAKYYWVHFTGSAPTSLQAPNVLKYGQISYTSY